eukprot:GSMAST32.ASY1.ANO1.65.1 assembled CDS
MKDALPRGYRDFTEEEDEVLRVCTIETGAINWSKIANEMTEYKRTAKDCRYRWNSALMNQPVKGPWSEDEDALLILLVGRFGSKKWSNIAEYVPGRKGKQCRERWLNHLDPTLKKGPWSAKELQILVSAQHEFGNSWAKIAKQIPGRSENTVKNQWNSLMHRQWSKMLRDEKATAHEEESNDNNVAGRLQELYVSTKVCSNKDTQPEAPGTPVPLSISPRENNLLRAIYGSLGGNGEELPRVPPRSYNSRLPHHCNSKASITPRMAAAVSSRTLNSAAVHAALPFGQGRRGNAARHDTAHISTNGNKSYKSGILEQKIDCVFDINGEMATNRDHTILRNDTSAWKRDLPHEKNEMTIENIHNDTDVLQITNSFIESEVKRQQMFAMFQMTKDDKDTAVQKAIALQLQAKEDLKRKKIELAKLKKKKKAELRAKKKILKANRKLQSRITSKKGKSKHSFVNPFHNAVGFNNFDDLQIIDVNPYASLRVSTHNSTHHKGQINDVKNHFNAEFLSPTASRLIEVSRRYSGGHWMSDIERQNAKVGLVQQLSDEISGRQQNTSDTLCIIGEGISVSPRRAASKRKMMSPLSRNFSQLTPLAKQLIHVSKSFKRGEFSVEERFMLKDDIIAKAKHRVNENGKPNKMCIDTSNTDVNDFHESSKSRPQILSSPLLSILEIGCDGNTPRWMSDLGFKFNKESPLPFVLLSPAVV